MDYMYLEWRDVIHSYMFDPTCNLLSFHFPSPVHDMSLGNPVQEPPRGCRVMMRHDVSFRSMCRISLTQRSPFLSCFQMTSKYTMLLDELVECSNLFIHLFFAYILPTWSLRLWESGVSSCQLHSVTRSVGPLCCGGICHRAPVPLLACQKQHTPFGETS